MREEKQSERLATVAVVALLLLTAWGNAYAMLFVSGLGLIVG